MRRLLIFVGAAAVLAAAAGALTDHCALVIAAGSVGALATAVGLDGGGGPRPTGR